MTEKGVKIWKIFVKVVKILFAFIPIHETIVNGKDKDKSEVETKN